MNAKATVVALIPMLAAMIWLNCPGHAQAGGLYGDESKNVTTGDLKDQDYWATKFDMMMLDIAIKEHQPEGRIGLNLAVADRRLDDLIKKYPKHEQLKQWKAKVTETIKKIDPDAQRNADWNPGCPWDEANFSQAWINFHYGKMLIAANDIPDARGIWGNVKQNFEILTRPDRLKDYPADLKKWVEDHKQEVSDIADQLKNR